MIEVMMCSGECRSASIWSEQNEQYNKQCACCGVASSEEVEIEIVHPTLGSKMHKHTKLTGCGCAATKCAATEAQLEELEEKVVEELVEAKEEIKDDMKQKLNKREFKKVKNVLKDQIKDLKQTITGLFGF